MATFIAVPAMDMGDDESEEILVNVDQVKWVSEVDTKAVLDFGQGETRTLAITLAKFYTMVRGR